MYSSKFTTNDNDNATATNERSSISVIYCICPSTVKWCRRPTQPLLPPVRTENAYFYQFQRRCLAITQQLNGNRSNARAHTKKRNVTSTRFERAKIYCSTHKILNTRLLIGIRRIVIQQRPCCQVEHDSVSFHSLFLSALSLCAFGGGEEMVGRRVRLSEMCLWHLFENYPLSSNKQIVLSHAPSLRRPSNHGMVLLAIASNCTSCAVLSTNTRRRNEFPFCTLRHAVRHSASRLYSQLVSAKLFVLTFGIRIVSPFLLVRTKLHR